MTVDGRSANNEHAILIDINDKTSIVSNFIIVILNNLTNQTDFSVLSVLLVLRIYTV
jgi:hypothetical protein